MPLAASSWSLSIGGSSAAAYGAGDRRRLEEAHDGDGERAGSERADVVERRGHGRRQPRRDRGDQGDAVFVERRDVDEDDPERRRRAAAQAVCGTIRLTPRSTASVAAEKATVVQLTSPRSSMMPAHLVEEALGVGVAGDAEQLGELTGGDGEPDADLDPGQRRLGDVVDQRAEPQQRGRRGGSAPTSSVSIARSPTGSVRSGGDTGGDQRRSGEQSHGRRRAHRHRAGAAEQGVDDHRHHARVQPDLAPGDRRSWRRPSPAGSRRRRQQARRRGPWRATCARTRVARSLTARRWRGSSRGERRDQSLRPAMPLPSNLAPSTSRITNMITALCADMNCLISSSRRALPGTNR